MTDRGVPPPPDEPFVLHGSMISILNAYLSPVLLIALSVGVAVTRRLNVATLVIGALGCVLAFIALFDMPLRTEFSREGVTRVCALRRHHIPWSRVSGIERLPTRAAMRRAAKDPDRPRQPGGLVAVIGRRRYMLVNRTEGALEYDRLVVAVRRWDDVVTVRARRPPVTTPPTSLYRRGGARPEDRRRRGGER